MLPEIVTAIQLIQEIISIRKDLKANAENIKRLCERANIFTQVLERYQSDSNLEITPNLKTALDFLIQTLQDIKKLARKYKYDESSRILNLKKMFTNISHRQSQAKTIIDLNTSLNECALNLQVVQQIEFESFRQQNLNDFRHEFEETNQEIIRELSQIKDNSQAIQQILVDLQETTGNTSNSRFQQELLVLKTQINQQGSLSSQDILTFQQFLTQETQTILTSIEHIFSSLKDIHETTLSVHQNTETIIKETKLLTEMMNKLLLGQTLTPQENNSRDQLLEKLRLPSNTMLSIRREVCLGRGGFGEVCFGLYDDHKVAIKSIRKDRMGSEPQKTMQAIENELLLMNYLGSHPNILLVYGFLQEMDEVCVVLELSSYGSLASLLFNVKDFPQLSLRLSLAWLKDLIVAIDFLHGKNIKHRDIKAENMLLFSELTVKLCDFGLAKEHSSQQKSQTTLASGTTAFMAPEVLARKGSLFASDIYSFLMTIYQILLRKTPSILDSSEYLIQQMLTRIESEVNSDEREMLVSTMRRLFVSCVDENPERRPTAKQLVPQIKQLIRELNGDPRLKQLPSDAMEIQTIEQTAQSLFQQKLSNNSTSNSPFETSQTTSQTSNKSLQQLSQTYELTSQQTQSLQSLFEWMISLNILTKNAWQYCELILQKFSISCLLDLYLIVIHDKHVSLDELNISNKLDVQKILKGLESLSLESFQKPKISLSFEQSEHLLNELLLQNHNPEILFQLKSNPSFENKIILFEYFFQLEEKKAEAELIAKEIIGQALDFYANEELSFQIKHKFVCFLIQCYANGWGVEQNHEKEYSLSLTHANDNCAKAQVCVGSCYFNGRGVKKDEKKAMEWFLKAAEEGNDALAQYYLGVCYQNGLGTKKDLVVAVDWYRKAVKQGHVNAQNMLAVCYYNGFGVEVDLRKAFGLFRKAAEVGHTNAQHSLGICYAYGHGPTLDKAKAVDWYLKAAEKGSAKAQYSLGLSYFNGHGVKKDLEQAMVWYLKAAEQGLAKAQFSAGLSYENGQGVAQDKTKAFEWYVKSAEQGYANAQYSLGLCYLNGSGVSQNKDKAFEWFLKSSEQGYAKAQYNLGLCYQDGLGTDKNDEKAIEWFEKASEQGHVNAQHCLAICLSSEKTIKQDLNKAFHWFEIAATQGNNAKSQYHLALCYEEGKGTEPNKEKSLEMLKKASEQGYILAQNKLKQINNK